MEKIDTPILVTGAAGYLGSHTVIQLINLGYKVRGTVRSVANKDRYSFIYNHIKGKEDKIEWVEADLMKAEDWESVCKGIEYAIHTASPIGKEGMTEEQYVSEALAGANNFFDAAIKAGVKKIVYTSSAAAIFPGNTDKVMDETMWSDEKIVSGYFLSKLKAERRVWELYENHKGKFELSTVCPGGIFGPMLSKSHMSSPQLLIGLMNDYPGVVGKDSPLSFIDVRDCAAVHV